MVLKWPKCAENVAQTITIITNIYRCKSVDSAFSLFHVSINQTCLAIGVSSLCHRQMMTNVCAAHTSVNLITLTSRCFVQRTKIIDIPYHLYIQHQGCRESSENHSSMSTRLMNPLNKYLDIFKVYEQSIRIRKYAYITALGFKKSGPSQLYRLNI